MAKHILFGLVVLQILAEQSIFGLFHNYGCGASFPAPAPIPFPVAPPAYSCGVKYPPMPYSHCGHPMQLPIPHQLKPYPLVYKTPCCDEHQYMPVIPKPVLPSICKPKQLYYPTPCANLPSHLPSGCGCCW